jgi:hypothetical protein
VLFRSNRGIYGSELTDFLEKIARNEEAGFYWYSSPSVYTSRYNFRVFNELLTITTCGADLTMQGASDSLESHIYRDKVAHEIGLFVAKLNRHRIEPQKIVKVLNTGLEELRSRTK